MTAADHLIEVRNLDFSRGTRPIFRNLNLTIGRGDVTAIMGPSGTGKTTLLQLITRQLTPDSGQVLVDGIDIATLSQSELYRLRQRFGVLLRYRLAGRGNAINARCGSTSVGQAYKQQREQDKRPDGSHDSPSDETTFIPD